MRAYRPCIVGALLILAMTGALYVSRGIGAVARLRTETPTTTAYMARCRKMPVQRIVALDEISPALVRAVVLAEDPHFFTHRGVDLTLVRRAISLNWRAGRVVRGASTITMQLAKNLFLSPKQSLWRKANEVLITLVMEAMLSKERILELYLNIAEWGPRVYGVEVAARYHFDTSAADLTAREAAMLASLLPNPKLTSSRIYRRRFALAARLIHHRLAGEGF